MSDRKIRIAMCANDLNMNGISTVIMNYCSNLNLKKYSVSILVGSPVASAHRGTCERLGIKVVELPGRKASAMQYYLALNKALAEQKYDIFHIHGNSATMTIELLIAKWNGIKIRIAHSHNTTCKSQRAHKLLYPVFVHVYTHAFACGEDAGKWLFKDKKFYVIPNGFQTERFAFQESERKRIREELGIQDKFVVGHIGRFNEQKNQPFLLEVFQFIAEQKKEACLLLVGKGPDFAKIQTLAEQHPFKENIILYGESENAAAMYAAMDVFVLPSRYEGLPVVLLEAQISGLPCVVSDAVTREAAFEDRAVYLSLCDERKKWADMIAEAEPIDRKKYYQEHKQEIERYHISNDVKMLDGLYSEFLKNLNKRWR